MHALQSLYRCLTLRCPDIHKKRITSLCAAAMAAESGSVLSVSDLGRGIMGSVSAKHNIKRVDRLLSNKQLHAELPQIYCAMAREVIEPGTSPLIIVDWSELAHDRHWHLLRAALAVEGRAVTLYEQVYPERELESLQAHTGFLKALAAVLPPGCIPVIVTDAGFRGSWFHLVNQMGWMWLGRIRNRDMVQRAGGKVWEGCKTLYERATTSAQCLGQYQYVRSNPVTCRLVLVRLGSKGRHQLRLDGKRATSHHSRKQSRTQSEPWLLATCPALSTLAPETVVALYAQRMEIELAFRDLKSERYGLGMEASRSKRPERLAVLLLIAALAMFMLRLIGEHARAQGLEREFQSNTRSSRPTLSVMSLALQFVRKKLSTLAEQVFNAVFKDLCDGKVASI